ELISSSLAIDQNFPAIRGAGADKVIGFAGDDRLSSTLRNVRYEDAYRELRGERAYNVLLIDGAILQFLYKFEGGLLTKHRLAFFPSPDLLEFQNNSEIYDADEIYGDVVDKGVVTSPIRFDFDRENFIELEHPMSHMTIGQYKNCRIPVTGALSPAQFGEFVLRSFYNTGFRKFLADCDFGDNSFSPTIADNERKICHFSLKSK
ncbi:MAG: hypothetical protein RIT17_167, partial [Pseudomonadota bacterium]